MTKDDLEIKFDENLVFSDYEKVNPQTKVLLDKFGLDDRLFQPRKKPSYRNDTFSGQKRTHQEMQYNSYTPKHYNKQNQGYFYKKSQKYLINLEKILQYQF